ncbi:hypothetical protein [Marisediminicola sp. LYQ134]|uniref:hypothetical protein n=1 Tax=Marisediminicola sp. LYQ134 TaxID=3391061 RepID=UPI003983324E
MMRDRGIPRPSVEVSYTSLITTYVFLIGYAVTAAVVSLPSLEQVFSSTLVSVISSIIAALGFVAIAGVLRTRRNPQKPMLEIVSTYLFYLFLVAYPIVIIIRTLDDGEISRLPYAWITVAACPVPYSRVRRLAGKIPKRGGA